MEVDLKEAEAKNRDQQVELDEANRQVESFEKINEEIQTTQKQSIELQRAQTLDKEDKIKIKMAE